MKRETVVLFFAWCFATYGMPAAEHTASASSATSDASASAAASAAVAPPKSEVVKIPSKDGASIAVECTSQGPTLLLVHGGIGDRTRWTPMFPLLAPHFRVCAMDRRGHGESGDGPSYGMQKEAEDVAAVVDAQHAPVFVLGHSYGGVAALEAAFLTKNIAKLVLYEPPVKDKVNLGLVTKVEALIREGKREDAVALFLREVVKVTPAEIEEMKKRPAWKNQVAGIDAHPRQMRALAAYKYDPKRVATIKAPTLLLTGSETASPDLKAAIESLKTTMANATVVVLQGQQHNAMDASGRQKLSEVLGDYLLAK